MSRGKKFLLIFFIIAGPVVIGNLSVPQQWRAESYSPDLQQIESLKKSDLETVRSVRERYDWLLLFIPGVNGIGTGLCDAGEKRLCIEIYLERETTAARILIPRSLEGIPVEWEVIGKIIPY